jgi:hypothetical protein
MYVVEPANRKWSFFGVGSAMAEAAGVSTIRSLSSSASCRPSWKSFGKQLDDHLPGAGRHSEAVPGVDEPPPADRRTYAADNYARRYARV